MKYLGIIIVAIILGIGSFFFLSNRSDGKITPPVTKEAQKQEAQTTQEIANPQTIIIEKIGVNAPVESVGLDTENKMDVPKDPDNAGWYNLGYKPGKVGSAVIAGHVDTPTGAPAVFYKLSSLVKGDKIVVRDINGAEYEFEVIENTLYDFDKVPLQKVFASSDAKRLNLITCDGAFDRESKNYTKRRVVYAKAIEPSS
jgi:sortase A